MVVQRATLPTFAPAPQRVLRRTTRRAAMRQHPITPARLAKELLFLFADPERVTARSTGARDRLRGRCSPSHPRRIRYSRLADARGARVLEPRDPRVCDRRARRPLIRFTLQLLRSIHSELGDSRLRVVPNSRAILIEVRRRAREPSKRVAEDYRWFAGHDTAERYMAILETTMRRAGCGRRPHVYRARHPTRGMNASEIWLLRVDFEWPRIGAIDIPLDDRRPGIRQISRELELHARVIDRRSALACRPRARRDQP
jgi:hypothetical protein